MMNLIILGPQGSGKGTQAELLTKKKGYHHLEIGNVLREKAKENTPLGQKLYRIMNKKGILVSEQIMEQIVNSWLDGVEVKKGIVFDGYPRNLTQYQTLEKMLAKKKAKINMAIYLKISQQLSLKRLTARRVCPKCSSKYNLVTKPPKKDELCDQCQVKLIKRKDDLPHLVEKRLKIYYQSTQPLVDYVRKKGILEEIDGERPIEPIHQDIMGRISKYQAGKK